MNDQDWLEEGMREVCNANGVDFNELLDQVNRGLHGVDIPHFTDGQLAVLKAALEVAGGV